MPIFKKGPLNYPANQVDPIRRFTYDRAPTVADYKQYIVGDHWLDQSSNDWWILCYRDSTQGIWRKMAGTAAAVETFIPDAGTSPVVPTATNQITLTGGNNITTTGGLNTMTWDLTGTTDHAIQIGNATGSLTSLAVATNGQIPIGSTGADPVIGNITSTGGTITITNGAGTINLETAGGILSQVTAEDATTCAPALGNLNIVGTATNGINTTAAGSTLTVSMATPYSDGDFEFRNATAGATRTVSVTHTDNTNAASHANLSVETGGAAGGDPFFHLEIAGVAEKSFGFDNTDDNLKITTGATPSTGTTHWNMTTGGIRTLALQPRFRATMSADIDDVTGDASDYTVIFNTETYDITGNYNNATGIFTAPVDGLYLFTSVLGSHDYAVGNTNYVHYLFTGGGNGLIAFSPSVVFRAAYPEQIITNNSVLAYLTSGQTAGVRIRVDGAAKLIDINSSVSHFEGCLLF